MMDNRIRQERAAVSYSQSRLAEYLKVSRTTLARWESGAIELPSTAINQLCDLFGCSADWLLCRSDYRRSA